MTSYFDRLGLTPQERRLVVFVAAVVFLVLNLWLVWPRFKDWGQVNAEMAGARQKIETYQAEIAHTGEYERKLKALEGEGSSVLPDEAANALQGRIQTQAALSQLTTTGINPVGTAPGREAQVNEFFEERAMRVGFLSGDAELVDFMVSIGSGDSMIRVRDVDVRPDASGSKLQGNMTLVASFRRKQEAKAVAPPKTAPTKAASLKADGAKSTPATSKAQGGAINQPANAKTPAMATNRPPVNKTVSTNKTPAGKLEKLRPTPK
jgi:hypothetical protein